MSKHLEDAAAIVASGPPAQPTGIVPEPAARPPRHRSRGAVEALANKENLITVICFAFIAVLAIRNHFIQDDGFITLRYVDNLLRGHGPVWYPGSSEFGYTNFLFMVLVSAVSLVGFDPVVSASIVSYSAFFGCAFLTYAIASRLTSGNSVVAAATVAVIFSNYTVSSYASGLMETSLQLALVMMTYHSVLLVRDRPRDVRHLYVATAAGVLGLLTRLDTILLIAPAFLFLFYCIWQAPESRRRMIGHMAIALGAAALVMSAFLAFCFLFYGQILPTTFYVKGERNLTFGWIYLGKFLFEELLVYLYLPGIVLFHWRRTKGRLPPLRRWSGFALALSVAALTWIAYVIYVGGGFMGYRLMVPFIAIFLLVTFTIAGRHFRASFAALLAVIVLLSQAGQYFWFSRLEYATGKVIENPSSLDWHLHQPHVSLRIVGMRLNELFYTGSRSDVMIAVRGAGAKPYYSRLPTYDIHGLNTRDVAMNGVFAGHRPGHRFWATVEQLKAAGANLIVSTAACLDDVRDFQPTEQAALYARGLRTVFIPLPTAGCWIVTYYVEPHPDIDHGIEQGRFLASSAT